LVPLAAQVAGRVAVGVLAVGEEVECLVERGLHVCRGALGECELSFGGGGACGDAVLVLVEEVEGYGALVVGVQELGALVGELREPALLTGSLFLGLLAHPGECVVELHADRLQVLGWQGDVHV
jgi:hypothetical protein